MDDSHGWNERYLTGDLPWDTRRPSPELRDVVQKLNLSTGSALELGCGTGTNAIFLAQAGFSVTAIDLAPRALEIARQSAEVAGVTVDFIQASVQEFGVQAASFDFLFDRGCYHCVRRDDLDGYLATLRKVSRLGTWFLCLCGNDREQTQQGPPRVSEQEIRDELGSLFEISHIREFRFEDPDGSAGPLGWSVLMQRKE